MPAFTTLQGVAVPMPAENIDTDQILPGAAQHDVKPDCDLTLILALTLTLQRSHSEKVPPTLIEPYA